MKTTLETLVAGLYEARQASRTARKARATARGEAGECFRRDYPKQGPCWLIDPETWCGACAQVLPFYKAYHKAANRAGAALRLVLREGRRLSKTNKENPT
jgi:hypothetical protein